MTHFSTSGISGVKYMNIKDEKERNNGRTKHKRHEFVFKVTESRIP